MRKTLAPLLILLTSLNTYGTDQVAEVTEALRKGHYKEAIQSLQLLLEKAPNDARLWTLKGLALSGIGDTASALTSFEKALQITPHLLPALLGAAEIQYSTKNRAAEATLQRILSLQPENCTARSMLGVLAFEQQDYPSAVGYFEKCADQMTNNRLALWQFGQSLHSVVAPW